MAPLLKSMSSFPAMNMCPPARLQDFGSDKYDASLWIAKTMLLGRILNGPLWSRRPLKTSPYKLTNPKNYLMKNDY
jgi:hypothetical protein